MVVNRAKELIIVISKIFVPIGRCGNLYAIENTLYYEGNLVILKLLIREMGPENGN